MPGGLLKRAMKFTRPKMVALADQIAGGHKLPEWLLTWGEKKLGLHALNVAHERIENDWDAGVDANFFRLACKYLSLHYDLTGLENIPKEGPCVVVCNHPHGMSDGIMFGDVVMQVRQDVRIVVNEFLHCVRGMRPYQIKVDVYGGEAAKRANMAGMREILRWLRDGHCILVFPSGSAATFSWQDKGIIDDPWQENITSIIRKTKSTTVPMYISGHTGVFFQVVSMLAKGLRANFLPREILRDGRMRHKISLGPAIPPSVYESKETDAALTDYLRLRSMLLRYNHQEAAYNALCYDQKAAHDARGFAMYSSCPLDSRAEEHELQAEIDQLPKECFCYKGENSPLTVFAAEAKRIPLLLKEIGIQRERAFRAVGEGTGNACDLDQYDEWYVHLIMWDQKKRRLAGAYRIGHTDVIQKERGFQGIYNAQFFHFKRKIRKILQSGLEMGRAFITPEYQRNASSLDTLWMGIGRYLNKHPNYRYLYGTVSISQNYSDASRSLILSFLRQNCMNEELRHEVSAFYPPQKLGLRPEDERLLPRAVPDIRSLSAIVGEIEPDGKGIPVLLKQYHRLGGRMVSFGIDKNFGSVLDCLVIVKLDETPERIRQRYRGKDYDKEIANRSNG